MKVLYNILRVISLVLVICFGIMIFYDYLHYENSTSFPFYAYIIIRFLMFLLPSLILYIISIFIKRRI